MGKSKLDVVDDIIAYEQGELGEEATLELFQHLLDSGMVWKLQGSYGRVAAHLLEIGAIHMPHANANHRYSGAGSVSPLRIAERAALQPEQTAEQSK